MHILENSRYTILNEKLFSQIVKLESTSLVSRTAALETLQATHISDLLARVKVFLASIVAKINIFVQYSTSNNTLLFFVLTYAVLFGIYHSLIIHVAYVDNYLLLGYTSGFQKQVVVYVAYVILGCTSGS